MRATTFFAIALALAVGCTEAKRVGGHLNRELNPFASGRAPLLAVDRHGPYLMAQFRDGSSILTFFAPAANEACARMLRPEAELVYRKHGNFGRFERGEEICDVVGVGSLAAWRDRHPRPDTRSPVPRATARFQEVFRDDEVVGVRGRFPLASLVRVPAGYDLVAFLPRVPACERPLARGEASMEFVQAGPDAIRIVGENGLCPVAGFAMPVGREVSTSD